MNFKLATLILSTLAAVGSSSPVAAPEDKNSTAPGTFHKLVSGGPAGKAASPQADQPLTHLNPGCSGQQVPNIVKPGIFDLRDYNFNDKMSS
ncbi:MAG: hypothetical protein LQ342_000189, partial [Letrouitia transgressa]